MACAEQLRQLRNRLEQPNREPQSGADSCLDSRLLELRRYCRSDLKRLRFMRGLWEGLVTLKDFHRVAQSPMRSACYAARAVGGYWYFGAGQNTMSGERY